MRPHPTRDTVCYVLLGVIVVGLLATPLLPFVNRPALWFGLPSMLVWMVVLVALITPVLAVLEAGGTQRSGAAARNAEHGRPADADADAHIAEDGS